MTMTQVLSCSKWGPPAVTHLRGDFGEPRKRLDWIATDSGRLPLASGEEINQGSKVMSSQQNTILTCFFLQCIFLRTHLAKAGSAFLGRTSASRLEAVLGSEFSTLLQPFSSASWEFVLRVAAAPEYLFPILHF